MGLLLSFSSVWWALPITALALIGYFLLPGIFYLWMASPGRRRDDRPRPVHPLEVVNHGRTERNHPPAGAPAHHGRPGHPGGRRRGGLHLPARPAEVTDGNLGAHLRKLEEAGYIAVNKIFVERKPRTYVSATAEGRKVFQEHVAALESILKSK